jgi:hypothetical protein
MWFEFEAGQSPEARFAKALDRFQPLLLNIAVGGGTWEENGVIELQVIERYGPAIKGGSATLLECCIKARPGSLTARRDSACHAARLIAELGVNLGF